MTARPLVSARDLRVDVDDAVVLDHVTFDAIGASLAVWGDAYGFERALLGHARIRSGSLAIAEHEVSGKASPPLGTIGVALCDPPVPARWTVRDYLLAGAALSGLNRAAARASTEQLLDEWRLVSLAKARVAELPLPERRAVTLAEAVVSGPAVLLAVAPLSGLSGQQASYVAAVFAEAVRGRRWIASVRDLHPASSEYLLAASADQVVGFAGGKLVHQGKLQRSHPPPASSTSSAPPSIVTIGYTLVMRGDAGALREALRARGVVLVGGPVRFFVELTSELSVSDVLAIALTVRAPIIELVPRVATSYPTPREI